jgi:drug/metabolite transporter (DMT)-like permease
MTALALALVLAAAAAHATWNFLTKASESPLAFSWCFSVLGCLLYLPLVVFSLWTAPPSPAGWAILAGTATLHLTYFSLLNAAYARADLSLVYPVARGTGVALVPMLSVALLGEHVSLPAAAAIGAIVAGVVVVHLRGLRRGLRHGLASVVREPGGRFAIATGFTIAAYSIWDKNALAHVEPVVLNYAGFAGLAIAPAPLILGHTLRRAALRREVKRRWPAMLAAAILAPLAYLLVLIALTFSRVSYVAPAREVGIVVGAALGTFVLREPFGANRLLGAALVAAGVLGLALAP